MFRRSDDACCSFLNFRDSSTLYVTGRGAPPPPSAFALSSEGPTCSGPLCSAMVEPTRELSVACTDTTISRSVRPCSVAGFYSTITLYPSEFRPMEPFAVPPCTCDASSAVCSI